MKYRVYTEQNKEATTDFIFASYFKTKREAESFAENQEKPIIERKVGSSWIKY